MRISIKGYLEKEGFLREISRYPLTAAAINAKRKRTRILAKAAIVQRTPQARIPMIPYTPKPSMLIALAISCLG